MKIPNNGSKWQGNERDIFVVLSTVVLENHTWIHYRKETTGQEYSCYLESFLSRFTELPK